MVHINRNLSLLILSLFLVSQTAKSETLFEGYSKVLLGGIHVGYFVNKYEYDSNKKMFTSTYFLKTNEFGGNMTESLKATANDKIEPLGYQYTSVAGTDSKTIDAKFVKGKIKATIIQNGKKEIIDQDFPKGAFLSTFLAYVMLKSPKGLQTGVKYEYQALAEEDGKLYRGLAYVKELEELKGLKVFKVLNDFKDVKFISYATEKGDVLGTKSPVTSIATELVVNPDEATKGFTVNLGNLKVLFGSVPNGKMNALASGATASTVNPPVTNKFDKNNSKLPAETPTVPTDGNPKQQGIPPGKGIILKQGK